ncbi:hypothetical protein M231_03062 [Tremella mesenterica]|uniref:Protein PBN1 n=1 Tax=Tremella mesenterica TaxID=5217 RepID=A0A4V1M4A7_TREME|nr:hypothetical protein M231_03062 [Tremella mesenterica]
MFPYLTLLLLIWLILCDNVKADTEILNFRLPLSSPATPFELPPHTIELSSTQHQLQLQFNSSSPEHWVLLHFDEPYKEWTTRLSWPGSSPTRFTLTLYDLEPSENTALLHILSTPLAPEFPHPLLSLPLPFLMDYLRTFFSTSALPSLTELGTSRSPDKGHIKEENDGDDGLSQRQFSTGRNEKGQLWTFNTSAHLVLEPLNLGIPRTTLPLLIHLIIFGLGAICVVPIIIRLLERAQRWGEMKPKTK